MKVHVYRTAMVGGGLAYDVYVPEEEASAIARERCEYRVIHGSRTYLTYKDATLPDSHWDREKGWERYQAFLDHEKRSDAESLRIAKRAFSELDGVAQWNSLWYVGLPVERETHAMVELEV